MALTTLANVRAVPGLNNVVTAPDAWLNALIGAADNTIKRWCKQNLELRAYSEFLSGNDMPNLVLRQFPVLSGVTQIASGSNGAVLPQATINVVSTTGFDPGGRADLPTLSVQTSQNTWTTVTYTGTTATTFTGCAGGTGTLSSQPSFNAVGQPAVWVDNGAYWGQASPSVTPYAVGTGPFADGTLQVQGVNFALDLDERGQTSKRGLLRRLGGILANGGSYWGGWISPNINQGKLASGRVPCWPRGYGNIKIAYSAGYATVPDDLSYCATTLVANMIRNQPKGTELSSESLGSYSYSTLSASEDPEIGSIRQILTRYRDASW